VEHAAEGAEDDRVLRRAVLETVRTAVPFDAFAWLLTDPVTTVGRSPLAEVPCLEDLPRLIQLKYLTTVARWTAPGRPPVVSLLGSTAGRPADSLVWRELLGDLGVVDVASLLFADRFGCWGFLDLWRRAPAAPFSGQELTLLRALAPPVTAALRGSQAHSLLRQADGPAEPAGPVLLVLSRDLGVRATTPDTEHVLRRLVPPVGQALAVPAAAYNVGAQLLANETGVDQHPPSARLHAGGAAWLTVRAARLGAEDAAAADIAVTVERIAPVERLELFVRAVGLSGRERELVHILATGRSNKDAAQLMVLSRHTLGDHLKSVYAKTGCVSRAELMARATGS
jgi:DNA-binding CsgD family transcriptional regulator